MTNADRFLGAYNEIDKYLRHLTRGDKSEGFYKLIEIASRSDRRVRQFSIDLKEFADLRNAIVHERTDEHIIAEPNERAVAKIVRLAQILMDPPKVFPLFGVDNLFTLQADLPIANAVTVMEEKSYSQVPIFVRDKFKGLLTSNTVARWLGASVEEEIFSLTETLISDVLVHTEDRDHVTILGRNSDIFEVVDMFRQRERQGKRLEAILITHSGNADETPIGLITTYDFPKLQEVLDNRSRTMLKTG